MLKDGLGSGTLSAPQVMMLELSRSAAQKGVFRFGLQRSYPTPVAAKCLQRPPHMCWHMLVPNLFEAPPSQCNLEAGKIDSNWSA